MARPFLLLQLSDPHFGADWGGRDPEARLRRAVAEVRALPNPPDAVVVTGDLANDGLPERYGPVREVLDELGAPCYVLPGNHDARGPLRATFGLDGEGEEPIDYAADLGPLRLVAADTIVPGEDYGSLDPERLARIAALLAAEPERPTVLALHHPPLATGLPAWDAINLPAADRVALGEVLAAVPGVLAVIGGHLHRAVASSLAGRPVIAVPSVYAQVLPDFDAAEAPTDNAEPPAFALHVFRDGELSSQLVPYGP